MSIPSLVVDKTSRDEVIPNTDYVRHILASDAFRSSYLANPVPNRKLSSMSAIYVRNDSAEHERLGQWRPVASGNRRAAMAAGRRP